MGKLRDFLGKSFTSVTIMVIPHSKQKPLRLRVSAISLVVCFSLSVVGAGYVLSVGVKTVEYYGMKKKLSVFSSQATEMRVAISSLRKTESEVAKLLSFKSKKKILEQADVSSDLGSINIDLLKRQVDETIRSVAEIREYIKAEKSVYQATPTGWPAHGEITSSFGTRLHPISGISAFHSGVDIRTPPGAPVRATADGMVSLSNFGDGTGNVVVLEHGLGFTTVYAHNTRNSVRVGQRVKKGEIIAISGSTGSSTGPHVHYEVWKNKVHVNPTPFLKDIM